MSATPSLSGFFAAWGAETAGEREELLRGALSEAFAYTDPHVPEPITSVEALLGFLSQFTANMPGARAEVVEPVDSHHQHVRATVRFLMGEKIVTGQYFAECDTTGRLTRIAGFVGKGAG